MSNTTSDLLDKAMVDFFQSYYRALDLTDVQRPVLYKCLKAHEQSIMTQVIDEAWTAIEVDDGISLPMVQSSAYYKHLKVLLALLSVELDDPIDVEELIILPKASSSMPDKEAVMKQLPMNDPQMKGMFGAVYDQLNTYVASNNVNLEALSMDILSNGLSDPSKLLENPMIKNMVEQISGNMMKKNL